MKTAVSIPDDVFAAAEKLARRAGRSRSEVYGAALREYVARHAPDAVTEALDRTCSAIEDDDRTFRRAASHAALERTEW
jgi:metal-responsive CopG/Arc/MetJ family transcriptional regulator